MAKGILNEQGKSLPCVAWCRNKERAKKPAIEVGRSEAIQRCVRALLVELTSDKISCALSLLHIGLLASSESLVGDAITLGEEGPTIAPRSRCPWPSHLWFPLADSSTVGFALFVGSNITPWGYPC